MYKQTNTLTSSGCLDQLFQMKKRTWNMLAFQYGSALYLKQKLCLSSWKMTLCLHQFLPRSRTILQVVVYIMSGATMCHLRQRADETSFLCHASSTDRRKNQVLWSHVKSWHLVFTFLGPWSCSTHCRKTKYVHVITLNEPPNLKLATIPPRRGIWNFP